MITPTSETLTVAIKTPMMPSPLTARLSSELSLPQALQSICKRGTDDPVERRVMQQLDRETRGQHHYLWVTASGELHIVDSPADTRLSDIAETREIRTDDGIDEKTVAAFEVQAYAHVGTE